MRVANSQDATVSQIDPHTNRVVATVPVGEGPSGVASAPGGGIWVATSSPCNLSKIDPGLGKVVQSVPVGEQPQGVAVGAKSAYVAVRSSGLLHRGGTLTVAVANPPDAYQAGIPRSLDPASGYSEGSASDLDERWAGGLWALGRPGELQVLFPTSR